MTNLILGDSYLILKTLAADSVDAVVTDPPYGLSFMNKHWDHDVPSVELWREVLRVLKPGGHILSFGGTRTYHRMVVNIEDAGFEIRDQIAWLYGQGFPKSHNIKEGAHAGFGTALKPAIEPIVLARKPLIGTVAENVKTFGTGALNIDASRVEGMKRTPGYKSTEESRDAQGTWANRGLDRHCEVDVTQGRWPANVLFDEEAAAVLDEQSGTIKTKLPFKKLSQNTFGVGDDEVHKGQKFESQKGLGITLPGASRFFYVAKASKRERGEGNNHPTVKPIKLMEYLITLITPPGGTVLDPFMGSGTTGIAAKNLGFGFVGIERSEEYFEIAKRRI